MQITTKNISPTNIELTIIADDALLDKVRNDVVVALARDVNMAGFRKGHAPKALVEKAIDQNTLQSNFLDEAVNAMYVAAITKEKLRPVAQPEVSVKKFVPFTTVEITATVEVVGAITLADYKKIKVAKKIAKVTDQEVEAVLLDLRTRDAEKVEVARACKDGDEITIDFVGTDPKTKKAIDGATGNDYPLVLGSGTFIPGFESELIGLKSDAKKTFDITFPKDYGSKELQNKKVTFAITVKAVKEVILPKLGTAFAAKVGPFQTVAALKSDVLTQLQKEKDTQSLRELENEILETLADTSKVAIPLSLIEDEMDRMEEEEKRNLVYRGQTWQEHLDAENKTAEEHHEGQREQAEARVKTGLVLGEVAEAEGINVAPLDLDARIAELRKQYTDKQMQDELNKPENRREIASRILTEKTIERLVGYAITK